MFHRFSHPPRMLSFASSTLLLEWNIAADKHILPCSLTSSASPPALTAISKTYVLRDATDIEGRFSPTEAVVAVKTADF